MSFIVPLYCLARVRISCLSFTVSDERLLQNRNPCCSLVCVECYHNADWLGVLSTYEQASFPTTRPGSLINRLCRQERPSNKLSEQSP